MAPRFPCAKTVGATNEKRLRRKTAQIKAVLRFTRHPLKKSGKDLAYKESKRNDKAWIKINKEKKTKVFCGGYFRHLTVVENGPYNEATENGECLPEPAF
jgi:hypothetical protein